MIYFINVTLPASSNTIITIFLVQSIISGNIIINDYINTSSLLPQTRLVPLQACLVHSFHFRTSDHLFPLLHTFFSGSIVFVFYILFFVLIEHILQYLPKVECIGKFWDLRGLKMATVPLHLIDTLARHRILGWKACVPQIHEIYYSAVFHHPVYLRSLMPFCNHFFAKKPTFLSFLDYHFISGFLKFHDDIPLCGPMKSLSIWSLMYFHL